MNRVAIVGASGFVGSTLAEELVADGVSVRCLIHSAGNAWRLARRSIDLQLVDLMDRDSIGKAIEGCSHVVNCARGKSNVMVDGMKNLVEACREARPERLVHISSVAVYGDDFAIPAISEDHPTHPEKGSYGWKKLKQDEMVQQAAKNGLSSVIVCPPNISGPYSMFWEEICKTLRLGTFAFVDQGRFPCPLVDVGNLVQAIRLAMETDIADGRRLFVGDDPTRSWNEVVTALAEVLGIGEPIPNIPADDAAKMVLAMNPPRGSVKKTIGHLVSSDVRASLRKDPYIGGVEKLAVGWAKRLPESVQNRLRDDDRKEIRPSSPKTNVSVRLLGQQLRNVTYNGDAAKEVLGYQPNIDFQESIDRFDQFARLHWGLGSTPYQLLSQLSGCR